MFSCTRSRLTLITVMMVAGVLFAGEGPRPLSRDRLARLRTQQPARIEGMTRSLEAARFTLGLGGLDGFRAFNGITDAYGSTHVRYHQTYRGVEVFNGTLLGHLDESGRMLSPHATLQTGIDLAPADLLAPAAIQAIVAANLPGNGQLLPLRVQALVFPTKYQDGLKFRRTADGRVDLDPVFSVATPHKQDPYRWAFQVSALQVGARGLACTEFIVDGITGEILRKWDGVQHIDAASVGTGASQYNGAVTLNTQVLPGGSGRYTLRDTTRATQPWPDPQGRGWPEFDGVGSQTLSFDPNGPNGASSGCTPFTNDTDTWGNGGSFDWATDHPDQDFAPIGQTAAVDAHYAIQCVWDYYDNVLGRSGGIDGQGSSAVSIVHMVDSSTWGVWENAAWVPSLFVMEYGDGSVTGPLTCLDVAAHEMSHGVMSYTASLDEQGGESGGLNEGNSDIHGTMVKFYAWGAGCKGGTVPDTTTQAPGDHNTWDYLWTMGPQLSADGVTPMRWLYKPSKDGLSYDAWFQGLALDDPHFAMGPAIHAFYFLSAGASDKAGEDTYSPYLPAGMTGIGNDKAIRIWYHGMATKVTDIESDYHAIREAMVASASELYPAASGADSPETAAVKNAFAAVNVGAPASGPDPVQVTFPAHPASPFGDPRILVMPAMVPASLPVPTVLNASDTSVTWDLGGLSFSYPHGGRLDGGTFTAPMANAGAFWPVKASSTADPNQFAVNLVFGVSLDIDSDNDTDACDMATLALTYQRSDVGAACLYSSAKVADDICFELFLEGFRNAFQH
jgi:Zn-dependent metalloprotease